MVRLSMWRVLPGMLALLVLAGPVPLQASVAQPPITFTFSGVCMDCEGSATATLTLQDYVQGNSIDHDNLISFQYDGTDLLGPFSITANDDFVIYGLIPAVLPAYAGFHIYADSVRFDSFADGGWRVGGGEALADWGGEGVWDGAVPEPGAFLLVAAGMALIGFRRWKVRN